MKMIFNFINKRLSSMLRHLPLVLICLLLSSPAAAQEPKGIQDNSFLIEESYNQEAGVVQEISFFTWSPSTHSWLYSFTNEWPVTGIKHQFSYTLLGLHNSDFGGSGGGVGDIALNYRYQLVGDGDSKFACSPRLSVLLPTGDSHNGRGFGGTGYQTDIPASIMLHPKLAMHLNAGATWVPHGKNELGQRAGLTGYNLANSFVWLTSSRFNVMFETFYNDMEAVAAPGKTVRQKDLLLSPGIRWSHNFESGLQIVPGVAFPIGAGPTAGEKGVILYLSFEQPLKILNWQKKKKD
jgi:hypothetical protein